MIIERDSEQLSYVDWMTVLHILKNNTSSKCTRHSRETYRQPRANRRTRLTVPFRTDEKVTLPVHIIPAQPHTYSSIINQLCIQTTAVTAHRTCAMGQCGRLRLGEKFARGLYVMLDSRRLNAPLARMSMHCLIPRC
jgi:hypothetical protein